MTRFARYGHRKVGEATPWSQLRKKAAGDEMSELDRLEARRAARRLRRSKGKVCQCVTCACPCVGVRQLLVSATP